jgi:hypothetical protein
VGVCLTAVAAGGASLLGRVFVLALCVLTLGCTAYGPYRLGTAVPPRPAVITAPDGKYKMAFVEFGEDGFVQDPAPRESSQLGQAEALIRKARCPLVVVYVHGWQNNANSADVCRFQHFLDVLAHNPNLTRSRLDVIGVYLGWRGKSLDVDKVNIFTVWDREQAAHNIANARTAADGGTKGPTLAEAVTLLGKDVKKKKAEFHDQRVQPYAVFLGHSFGALVLEESITKSIVEAADSGSEDAINWDLAVTLNSANDSQNSRKLLDYLSTLYRHDAPNHRYVSRDHSGPLKTLPDTRPALISITSESDIATGAAFPAGSWLGGLFKARLLRDSDISLQTTKAIAKKRPGWQGGWFARLPIPGQPRKTAWRAEFATTCPGQNRDLINWKVTDLHTLPGAPGPFDNAFDLNVVKNREDGIFYTSEKKGGAELKRCSAPDYTPETGAAPTAEKEWHKWKLEPIDPHWRVPYRILRVPPMLIDGHSGIWSDNSIALLGAIFRMQFPFAPSQPSAPPKPRPFQVPAAPRHELLRLEREASLPNPPATPIAPAARPTPPPAPAKPAVPRARAALATKPSPPTGS